MPSTSLARKIAAASTYSSWKRVPHVSFIYEPDITPLYKRYLAGKEQFAAKAGVKLSFNTLVVKHIANTLAGFPKLCCSFSYHSLSHRLEYRMKGRVDINIPWLLPNGDMIPFRFQNVAGQSLAEFAQAIETLRASIPAADMDALMLDAAIRDTRAKLGRGELSAMTRLIPLTLLRLKDSAAKKPVHVALEGRIDPDGIIISNIGSLLKGIQGRFALLEIIEPKVLAIGISSIEETLRPSRREGGQFEQAMILPITLAFDHRALDFNDLVPFVAKLEERFAAGTILED